MRGQCNHFLLFFVIVVIMLLPCGLLLQVPSSYTTITPLVGEGNSQLQTEVASK